MSTQMTGYPSIDKPWLKYYKENAEEEANNIPQDKTVWDVIEEQLNKYIDIPALEFFGKVVSRKEFIDNVYLWAKVFKYLGVQEDEIVAYFGPFMPDVCYMTLALNMIGACPYFLKLAIAPEALAEETKDCRLAIVFDQMWNNVSMEFSKDRFEKVIVVKITDAMPAPKKHIVSLLSRIKNKDNIPKTPKYISAHEARKFATEYQGELRVPFVSDRRAFITSSSGTTLDGVVKGVVATNEATIAQLIMGVVSGTQYFLGDRCLNHFPPTASTSLNMLFLYPLYRGLTIVMDPRVSEKDFYNQVVKYRCNIVISTGSAWEKLFLRIEKEKSKGKIFDLSYAKAWAIGGEGTDVRKFARWKDLVTKAGSKNSMCSAYGSSELFSCICTEAVNARCDLSKSIMGVGIPYAGMRIGVFDSEGKELGYNQRGELWIKSQSAMKEYYNKPELTAQVKVNGWIHTGDLAEIDENGFVYIWGRCKDTISLPDGKEIYLFDIANKIKEKEYIDDAIVLPVPEQNPIQKLVAHIVWAEDATDERKVKYLEDLNKTLLDYLPAPLYMYAYAEHQGMLPYSPTTLKKDKNKLFKQTDGFYLVHDGKLQDITLP